MRTKTRDRFPLEIFVFGESIPLLDWFVIGFWRLKQIFCYFLRSFGFKMMFSEATGEHPSFLSRSCISYILVYNESKNSYLNSGIESESYNYIAEVTLRYAEEDYKRFGLEKFEKFLLKKTYCFSSKIFEEYLKKYNMS